MTTLRASSTLIASEPSLQRALLVRVLGRDENDPEVVTLGEEMRRSARVQTLLSERLPDGAIPRHPYAKWDGAHWVLAALAELGYPTGDESLIPLREQVLAWLLSPGRERRIAKRVAGRARFCASQEGNAIYALLTLGLADERVDSLVERLLETQWPDGGWNCDVRPEADSSSFHETWLPLRALALYGRLTGNAATRDAADRAAEVFLTRSLYRRQADGSVMRPSFVQLHYPAYWHYDILVGLTVMAEAGRLHDERCRDALDLLSSRRLPDGGFPADTRYYRVSETKVAGRSLVDWGPVDRWQSNPFVTLGALAILHAADYTDPAPASAHLISIQGGSRD